MSGQTNYITEVSWTDTITTWYVHINDAYNRLISKRGKRLRTRGPEPKFSDSEVITVSLIIETFFQGHEEVGYSFVNQFLLEMFPDLIDLDRFNLRRRELIAVIEALRRDFRDQKIDPDNPIRLVDSAPVTLMTYTRGKRCRSVVGSQFFGVVSSKKAKFFGLRLHLTTTDSQLIDEWLLAPAAHHDGKVLEELVFNSSDLWLIGDKAYNDAEKEASFWQKRRILLLPLRKKNHPEPWPDDLRQALGRVRHRVETVFSVLTTVFNIQRPRGRSLAGHVVRIASCILAHTLSFFMS